MRTRWPSARSRSKPGASSSVNAPVPATKATRSTPSEEAATRRATSANMAGGMLSTRNHPWSSMARAAVERPAPDIPVTIRNSLMLHRHQQQQAGDGGGELVLLRPGEEPGRWRRLLHADDRKAVVGHGVDIVRQGPVDEGQHDVLGHLFEGGVLDEVGT